MKSQIIVNEVDCYRGNADYIPEFATGNSVQHQILLIDTDGTELCIGSRNCVADSDRGERIVFNAETSPRMIELVKKAIMLRRSMKSEYCDSREEFNAARTFNAPFYKQINEVIAEMHSIQNLGISLRKFSNHLFY